MQSELDHVLWGVPDLEKAIETFADRTGVAPMRGGSHPGEGTRNALASLGEGVYFEIIAPDPDQELTGNLGGLLAALDGPRLMTMALRADDLAEVKQIYAEHGVKAEHINGSRKTADGAMLYWSLCETEHDLTPMDPRRPFYIDWKNTPHPSTATPTGCLFKSIAFSGPDAEDVRKLWTALGVPANFSAAEHYKTELVIDTPNGAVRFEGVF